MKGRAGTQCALTLPSSGPPPAWPTPLLRFMFRCVGQAGGGPLMSNVRPHAKCKAVYGELRVALQGRRALEPVASAQRLASSLVFVVLEAAPWRFARDATCCGERVNRIQVSGCRSGTLRPPVRWRAAHRWLHLRKNKFLKTNTSTWHSGKLRE
jgi:hypothetical protein